MKISICSVAVILALAAPAFAAGDVKKGEKEFKKCMTCHSIVGADGTDIKKGGKIGPNLCGVIGRTPGTYPEFKYSEFIVAAGATGKVWSEEEIATYVIDPSAWLKTVTGNDAAKSAMAFKLAKGGEDVAAFVASACPAAQ